LNPAFDPPADPQPLGDPASVPEPISAGLAALGLGVLALRVLGSRRTRGPLRSDPRP
jgi:hypothetical protein